jgi:hypothetical protein
MSPGECQFNIATVAGPCLVTGSRYFPVKFQFSPGSVKLDPFQG